VLNEHATVGVDCITVIIHLCNIMSTTSTNITPTLRLVRVGLWGPFYVEDSTEPIMPCCGIIYGDAGKEGDTFRYGIQ
jgi:hypothetical protein